MSKGLDQYLANRLTNDHVFQVVTDPKLADAFLTDRVGESLQSKLEEIFPPPAPEKPAPAEKEEKRRKRTKTRSLPANPLLTETVNKLATPGRTPRSAAAKARCSWWTPSRARWSGRYTSSPRVRAPKNWIAQPPTL